MYIMYGNASNHTPSHAHVFLYLVRRVHPQAYNYDLHDCQNHYFHKFVNANITLGLPISPPPSSWTHCTHINK